MWTRADLKREAKQHLRGRYWSAFAVALIIGLIGGGTGTQFTFNFDADDFNWFGNGSLPGSGDIQNRIQEFLNSINPALIALFVTGTLLAVLFAFAFSIFVSSVIEAGGFRWFSRSREMAAPPSVGFMFSLFRSGNYLPTVAAQFWRYLFLFLWGLIPGAFAIVGAIVLFVPIAVSAANNRGGVSGLNALWPALVIVYILGVLLFSIFVINRQYAYRMVPWILGDNPAIGRRRALRLSIEMTRGHKLEMFVLDLSFIGWFLLGVLACVIGTLFVMPYYIAAQAELFDRLRALAVEKNIARMEDFGFVRVDPA